MATSIVQICNLALDACGTRSTITSLQEQSAEAQACARHYQPSLNAVLRAAHWNFARKQVTLALLKDATTTPPETVPQPWTYEYAYPNDCVLARQLMPTYDVSNGLTFQGWATPAPTSPIGAPTRFVIAQDNDVNNNPILVILTNMVTAQCIYTCTVQNPNLFDAQFQEALSYYIASRICVALTSDRARAKDLFMVADALTRGARAYNGNEGITVIDTVPDWIRVRGYLSDWGYPPGSLSIYGPQDLQMLV